MLLIASCKKQENLEFSEAPAGDNLKGDASTSATPTGPPTVTVYPVRAPHNHGWNSGLTSTGPYTCDREYSNEDFIGSGPDAHYGNDIFGALGAPIVSPVAGTLVTVVNTTTGGLGRHVYIRQSNGWHHVLGHLNSLTAGLAVGQTVTAGQSIGTMGATGTNSGGSVHLHYSINHGPGYWSTGIDPFPYTYPVELNVCGPVSPPSYIFETFASGVGRFYRAPTYSGSTVGISTTSSATHYVNGSSTHLKVTMNDNTSVTTPWFVRLLSGSGNVSENVQSAKTGTLYFYLKTTSAQTGATVRIWVDDSDGTEQSPPITVINDGAWHKYSWSLSNFNGVGAVGGNGAIDAASVTLDAIILSQPNTSATWTAYIDDVGN